MENEQRHAAQGQMIALIQVGHSIQSQYQKS